MKVSSNNCIAVLYSDITIGELEEYLQSVILEAEIFVFGRQISSKWILNVPPMGVCYLWLDNQKVFNVIIGKSPEGLRITTERINIFTIDWSDPPVNCEKFIVKDSKIGNVSIKQASFTRVTDDLTEGKLFCNNILPQTIKAEHIENIFKPFVTRGELTITRNSLGNFYIGFENKDDAYFALCMRKKYYCDTTNIRFSFTYARK